MYEIMKPNGVPEFVELEERMTEDEERKKRLR